MDTDQTTPIGAVLSGSTLFVKVTSNEKSKNDLCCFDALRVQNVTVRFFMKCTLICVVQTVY